LQGSGVTSLKCVEIYDTDLLQISRRIRKFKNCENRSTSVKLMNECIVAQFLLRHGVVGALDIYRSKVRELGVCWNDEFQRIFGLNRCESVKLIQYFCGALDLKHYYDIQHWRFVSKC